jgi:hypothetical protein
MIAQENRPMGASHLPQSLAQEMVLAQPKMPFTYKMTGIFFLKKGIGIPSPGFCLVYRLRVTNGRSCAGNWSGTRRFFSSSSSQSPTQTSRRYGTLSPGHFIATIGAYI